MLSFTSTVYDPLGFVGPFIMRAKILFQELCRQKLDWDKAIPKYVADQWIRWLQDLPKIADFKVPRCLKPSDRLQAPAAFQLHHFSDASEKGFGAVTYLRMVDASDRIHCCLVMAKSRLAPIKPTTIQRLELSAAVVAVKLDQACRKHLEYPLSESVFWTDSTIVLHYLRSEKKRFQTFVANRVAQIHEGSSSSRWRHVDTNSNPADDISRGMSADEMITDERWTQGPTFLWSKEELWSAQPDLGDIPTAAEIKKVREIYSTTATEAKATKTTVDKRFKRFSSWHELKRAVAIILRVKDILRKKSDVKRTEPVTVKEIQRAEQAIIVYMQRSWHADPTKLQQLEKLSPVMSADGMLRVGGRLSNAPLPDHDSAKHPAILPPDHHVTKLIIEHFHKITGYAGAERVFAEIRQNYWSIKDRVSVKRAVRNCIPCKKRKQLPSVQYMADLPRDRVTPSQPPFTEVVVDYFGPLKVKRARKTEVKRYGCLFTCLATRSVHLEVACSLDTDSFINALQRFIARRGNPKTIRSDNGSNFVGAKRELHEAIKEWNQQKIADYLLQQDVQWIFNPPAASHMGGVWERQIRTVRAVLSGIVSQQTIDDERLSTLFCIVEDIVNGRPLTKFSDDPNDPAPLTPNHLLLLRSGPDLPPGKFVQQDTYRQRWRQVQYLADVFWTRWIKEYLPTLQERQKRLKRERNFQKGDLVLLVNETTPRYQWPLGLITQTYPSGDGLVRYAQIKTQNGLYTRPVHKLGLLEAELV
ncbi:PREDICTED: uncharacterized protein LOC106816399 [Priapulus caudatus]|uniref:Uncharacterized protein LOC106816399 n=1 Tax=Priapulus caudatus TaxID=37621 RepID=A0ABM1EWB5_PRICU|nr:PREDICTED: uncharacterized protein LOC106816399 [Priapulus caudatus]